MKKTINLIMLALLLMVGLQPVSAKDKVKELEDSIQQIKAQFDSLKLLEKQLCIEIQDLDNDVIVSKDTVNRMSHRLDSLIELRGILNHEKDELKKVAVTEEDIAKIKNNIDQYQISFVQMASAFLYIPYNKGAVDKIAIPAFEQSKGSSYYDNYGIILKLLRRYEEDRKQLRGFIDTALMAFDDLDKSKSNTPAVHTQKESESLLNETPDLLSAIGNATHNEDNNTDEKVIKKNNTKDNINSKFVDLRDKFNKLSCVRDYKAYGDGWEDTYLGEIIKGVEKIFNDIPSSAKNLDNVSKIFKGYLERLK